MVESTYEADIGTAGKNIVMIYAYTQAISPWKLVADIFVSYASEDRERVMPFVEAYESSEVI